MRTIRHGYKLVNEGAALECIKAGGCQGNRMHVMDNVKHMPLSMLVTEAIQRLQTHTFSCKQASYKILARC